MPHRKTLGIDLFAKRMLDESGVVQPFHYGMIYNLFGFDLRHAWIGLGKKLNHRGYSRHIDIRLLRHYG
jgi:hypothetical protein